jgi:hypothetical protein
MLGLTVAVFLAAYCVLRARKRDIPPLPPGPPSELLLGHYRVVPEDATFKQYAEWAKEYSTISKRIHPFAVDWTDTFSACQRAMSCFSKPLGQSGLS